MMAGWYQVFDDEQVQRQIRIRMRRKFQVLAVGLVSALVVFLWLLFENHPYWLAVTVSAAVAVPPVVYFVHMRRRLRRLVWCVRLSIRRFEGYDYARRRTVIDWTEVSRVRLSKGGLFVDTEEGTGAEVPDIFPSFSSLGHDILDYCELYEIPVLVGDTPIESLDIYETYPFLKDSAMVNDPG